MFVLGLGIGAAAALYLSRERPDNKHPHLKPLPSWEERKARIDAGAERLMRLRAG